MPLTQPPVKPVWAETATNPTDIVAPTDGYIQTGWPLSATPPSRQRFNWILNFLSGGMRYIMRRGVCDWAATETYELHDIVRGANFLLYRSRVATNLNFTPASNPSKWERFGNAPSKIYMADYFPNGDGTTTDQTVVALAVADAFTAGAELYWEAKTYLTTATIPNLHNVRHFGRGIIKRGSTLFKVSPRKGEQNNFYSSTSGNNANDGLTASEPTLTLQKAIDNLALYSPLKGNWVLNIGAGTYTETTTIPDGTNPGDDYLEVKGPIPPVGTAVGATTNSAGYALNATTVTLASAGTGSFIIGDTVTFAGSTSLHRITAGDTDVSNGGTISFLPGLNAVLGAAPVAITRVATSWQIPTAIMDVPGGGGLFAIDCGRWNRCKVSYVKCTNWVTANNGVGGISANDFSVLWTDNCHILKCREGIIGNNCQLYISGGVIEGVAWTTGAFPGGGGTNGVVAYAGTRLSLGYNSTNEQTGTIIQHWAASGYHGKARTHCVSTFGVFKSNSIACQLYTNSRFDDRTNIFRKNALCFKAQATMLTSDQLLGASEYNMGENYTQAPDAISIGTASGATTNATGYAIGLRTITLASAGTGSFVVGDIVTFAGQATEYRITAGDTDVSNGGTLTFTPGLVSAIPAATTAITLLQRYPNGNATIWNFEQYSSLEDGVHPTAIGPLDVARVRAATIMTGTIASTLARTLHTVPAGALAVNPAFNYYEVHLCGDGAGAVGAAKTVLLKLGGVTVATLTIATGTQSWSSRTEIWTTTNYGQVAANTTASGGATPTQQRSAPVGFDHWGAQDLEVWVTVPGAADTVTLQETRVIRWG